MGALLSGLVTVVTSGCFKPIEPPPCTPMEWTVASNIADTVLTNRGLKFIPGQTGSGDASTWCTNVAVHYTGYYNGTEFDTSRDDLRALLFTPGMGTLIDGFEQGVIGLPTCATRRLVIPPELAWGPEQVVNDSGRVLVPPNATVVFDIEVLEIRGEPTLVCDSIP